MLSFSDFRNIDLRIGKVVSAERVEGSEKLLKLKVDLGLEIGERQIVAGVGKFYETEALVGKEIVVVANLEPRSLMGLESQGMLLAADDEAGPILLIPDKEAKPGSKVK